MSWLSRAINLMTFSVIFYCTKCVVLNAALLLPPHQLVDDTCRRWTDFHTADILSIGLPE